MASGEPDCRDQFITERRVMVQSGSRILVIIPAYNEGRKIGQVVWSIRQEVPGCDILVINDGSRDGTAENAISAGQLYFASFCFI